MATIKSAEVKPVEVPTRFSVKPGDIVRYTKFQGYSKSPLRMVTKAALYSFDGKHQWTFINEDLTLPASSYERVAAGTEVVLVQE